VEEVADLQISKPETLCYVTQTTLSMDDTAAIIDALRVRFPAIQGPKKDDICYATQNRQDAVKQIASQCDVVLVVGSPNSSNSNRLKEVAERLGARAYLIDNAGQIKREWLEGKQKIGLSAGASAPEILVTQVIEQLQAWGVELGDESITRREKVVFSLPRELQA
jgi:4-hydroxy-3-methylbut-2-enyl diphosphate reductase